MGCSRQEYWSGGERWEGGSKGREYMHTYGWFMLRFDRKQQNSVNQFSSAQFSHLVVSDSLQPHGLQHTKLPVHHQLLELTQTHVHWVSNAIQPPHPTSSPSPPTFNLSQHQVLFQWVSSSHQWPKYWSFSSRWKCQWIFRTDFL